MSGHLSDWCLKSVYRTNTHCLISLCVSVCMCAVCVGVCVGGDHSGLTVYRDFKENGKIHKIQTHTKP